MPAPPLAELQDRLRRVLSDPRGPGAAANGGRGGRGPVLSFIQEAPPLGREERLGIYANAYFVRLLEALGAVFPAVHRILGPADFGRLVADYLSRHPSRSPIIENAAEALPAFLRGHELCRARPFLGDLARLEWEVLDCLCTDRLPDLDPRTVSAVPEDAWASARLTLDPSARVIEAEWPVDLTWKGSANRPTRRKRRLLLYRDDLWVRVEAMDGDAARAFRLLREGQALGDVCAELEAACGPRKAAETARRLLADWCRSGVIKGVMPGVACLRPGMI